MSRRAKPQCCPTPSSVKGDQRRAALRPPVFEIGPQFRLRLRPLGQHSHQVKLVAVDVGSELVPVLAAEPLVKERIDRVAGVDDIADVPRAGNDQSDRRISSYT